jgi:hypothetical protein
MILSIHALIPYQHSNYHDCASVELALMRSQAQLTVRHRIEAQAYPDLWGCLPRLLDVVLISKIKNITGSD